MQAPIRLTTAQLGQVEQAATPVPHALRSTFLQALAALLVPDGDGAVGDGALWRAALQAQRQVLHPVAAAPVNWPPQAA
jgi:hypothetical protein